MRANGRVRDVPNERLVRWYVTVGLVDPPLSRRGRVARYGRRHLLQLVAVKRRQAEGRSLAEIQAELAGATDEALAAAARVPDTTRPAPAAPAPTAPARFWARASAQERDPGGAEQDPGGAERDPGGAEQDPGGAEQDPGGAEQDPGGAEQDPGGAEQDAGGAERDPGERKRDPGGAEGDPGDTDRAAEGDPAARSGQGDRWPPLRAKAGRMRAGVGWCTGSGSRRG